MDDEITRPVGALKRAKPAASGHESRGSRLWCRTLNRMTKQRLGPSCLLVPWGWVQKKKMMKKKKRNQAIQVSLQSTSITEAYHSPSVYTFLVSCRPLRPPPSCSYLARGWSDSLDCDEGAELEAAELRGWRERASYGGWVLRGVEAMRDSWAPPKVDGREKDVCGGGGGGRRESMADTEAMWWNAGATAAHGKVGRKRIVIDSQCYG